MTALGVCYYPEHWPEDLWQADAAEMVAAGLTWVRIGEFAWSQIEPQPGNADWGWLDRAVQTLSDAGLKVVMGTPSATPPRWLVDQMPDMLALDAQGQPRGFGSRRHYSFAHAGYRAEAVRIARAMGERYGRHPAVQAWQIDNEYGCHDTVLSYSATDLAAFRDWLAQRYQSVDALNRAWGNTFWSMTYDSFDQIELPNLTVTEPSPAHVLAYRRFASDMVVDFNRAQANALRQLTDAPLIHNYMGRVTEFDHYAVGADLDIASWDSYPIGFLSDRLEASASHKRAYLRQGDPDFQAFHHDLYRSVGRGRWWVMEQQPGPVNWAPYNPAPLPGMVRLWAHEAAAHGAEAVCYFRWRQAPVAQEQMHAGLKRPDNAPAPGLAEARQAAMELAELGAQQAPQQSRLGNEVALIFDYESAWAWDIQPQGADFDYFALAFAVYQGVRRRGLNVDILPPSARDFKRYQAVFVPGLFTLPQGLAEALADSETPTLYGPRTGTRDPDFAIPHALGPGIPGLDARIALTESLPPSAPVPLKGGGAFTGWFEHLESQAAAPLKTDTGQPALVQSGPAHYLAGWPDPQALERVLLHLMGPATLMPEGIRRRETATHVLYLNYGAETFEGNGLTLPPGGLHWTAKT